MPERNGARITACYKIELHRPVTHLPSNDLRMLAHLSRDAPAASPVGHHVATVADMITRAILIGFDVVGTENFASIFK